MDNISRIHSNFDSLSDNYKGLPETKAAYETIESFVEKNGLLGDTGYSPHKNQLYNLISNYGLENEKQGFKYGFKYAFSLFLEINS